MPVYKTKLKNRFEIAGGSIALCLGKPPGFQFKPGQSLDLTLMNPSEMDSKGATRTFSIASAPYEDDVLAAAPLSDSAFKRVLTSMPLGSHVQCEGPKGSFTFHPDRDKAAVFLAEDVGITPIRSILRQADKEKLPHQLYLFYATHWPGDAPFLAEMQALSESNPRFIFIPAITQAKSSTQASSGERTLIGREMLADHFCDLHEPIYYIAGFSEAVSAMQQVLLSADVNEDHIFTEEIAAD